MTIPVGGVIQFAGATAPTDYKFCDGSTLASATYPDLFAAIGTTHGGDATNFALPDMRERTAVHPGGAISLGDAGGADAVTLSVAQLPAHSHDIGAYSDDGETDEPGGAYMAKAGGGESIYAGDSDDDLAPTGQTGNGQSVPTQSPYRALNFIIRVA